MLPVALLGATTTSAAPLRSKMRCEAQPKMSWSQTTVRSSFSIKTVDTHPSGSRDGRDRRGRKTTLG